MSELGVHRRQGNSAGWTGQTSGCKGGAGSRRAARRFCFSNGSEIYCLLGIVATRRALLLLHSLPTVLLSFPIYSFGKIPACVALALPGGRWVPAVWHSAASLSSCLLEATRQHFKVGRLRLNSAVHSHSTKITLWQQHLRRQLARLDRNCPPGLLNLSAGLWRGQRVRKNEAIAFGERLFVTASILLASLRP